MSAFTSFNVGPSQLDPVVAGAMHEACRSGVLSLSHRGPEFEAMYAEVEAGFARALAAPDDYALYFTSSATECWSVLAEGGYRRAALHLYSGAFGERWFQQGQRLRPDTQGVLMGLNDDPAALSLPPDPGYELIALTHNETSNTTTLSDEFIDQMRRRYPDALVAVDVTSSLGGVALPWRSADVWFGSVQKCLGLPSGLGVMLCSPRAVARFAQIGEQTQYNNLVAMERYRQKHQTTHTPNMLAIYLLGQVLTQRSPIGEVEAELRRRAALYYALLDGHSVLRPLVTRPASRSVVTIGVSVDESRVAEIRGQARALGMVLASGYGAWKPHSFRMANFPAIGQPAVERLLDFLSAVR